MENEHPFALTTNVLKYCDTRLFHFKTNRDDTEATVLTARRRPLSHFMTDANTPARCLAIVRRHFLTLERICRPKLILLIILFPHRSYRSIHSRVGLELQGSFNWEQENRVCSRRSH